MMNFRKNNISVIVVLPAFTQCYDDRQDPNGKGWFVTRDGFSYTPDFLNLDERMPNLIHYLDYNKLMNIPSNPPQWSHPNLSWTDRRRLARVDNCPQAGPNLFNDSTQFDYAYRYSTNSCHQDTQHFKDLVELLCSVNNCPEVVYMDMDLTYITSYSLEVLHMTISFGINLVDQCVEIDNCVAEILSTDHSQIVLNFLINQNIVNKDTHVAIASWTTWLIEIGQQMNELRVGGMAHTANEIFEQVLIPHSFAK
ncbi:unnamed protein product [Adineta steineri]|uniref:Uncharacterized protein n=1 Tax=Adineta steineri TaxID=433720 RepID=A0A815QKD8_9BILA|nr:unnamed protein product [Adineta steineri]